MLPDPSLRVMVAVSGGPDSVCLLHVLREIGVNVVGVAHFNHKLRGEASEEDARFVETMAREMGLEFWRADGLVGAGNLEQNLRRLRREFFADLTREAKCDRVALGHTRDDQAETVLFRILRGSGLTGIAGIPAATAEGFIRPLIEVTRAEVEEYLRSCRVAWREDASNDDRRFRRNRIRHDLLPQLAREWNPRISEALAQLGDLAREENLLAEEMSRPAYAATVREYRDSVEIDHSVLTELPRAVARRVVRRALKRVRGDLRRIEFQHVEEIVDGGVAAIAGVRMTSSLGTLRISAVTERAGSDQESVTIVIPGTYETNRGLLRVEISESTGTRCVNLKAARFAGRSLILRGWKAGDRYHPASSTNVRKLKELFQMYRIPLWQRRGWPIVESEGQIVWARRFGAARQFVAADESGPFLQIWEESNTDA